MSADVVCRRCGVRGHDVPLEGPRGHNCRVALARERGERGAAVGEPKTFLPWAVAPSPPDVYCMCSVPIPGGSYPSNLHGGTDGCKRCGNKLRKSDARDRLVEDNYDANFGVVEAAPHDMWAIFSPGMQDELRLGSSADVAEVLGVDRPSELLHAVPGSWARYRHGIAIKLGKLVGEDPR
jgi:hypothetical protein